MYRLKVGSWLIDYLIRQVVFIFSLLNLSPVLLEDLEQFLIIFPSFFRTKDIVQANNIKLDYKLVVKLYKYIQLQIE